MPTDQLKPVVGRSQSWEDGTAVHGRSATLMHRASPKRSGRLTVVHWKSRSQPPSSKRSLAGLKLLMLNDSSKPFVPDSRTSAAGPQTEPRGPAFQADRSRRLCCGDVMPRPSLLSRQRRWHVCRSVHAHHVAQSPKGRCWRLRQGRQAGFCGDGNRLHQGELGQIHSVVSRPHDRCRRSNVPLHTHTVR